MLGASSTDEALELSFPLRYPIDCAVIGVELVLVALLNKVLKGDGPAAPLRPADESGLPPEPRGGRTGVDGGSRSAALSPPSACKFKAVAALRSLKTGYPK